jgi:tellurite resistance protein
LINFDTASMRKLRAHLLDLSGQPVAPLYGGRRAMENSPEEQAIVERFLPFAELFHLVGMSDGRFDSRERSVTLGAFLALTGGRVQAATLRRAQQQLEDRCAGCDVDERLEYVCARLATDREDAELAFTLASAVALADERVDAGENELLERLARWLRISPRRIVELLQPRSPSLTPSPVASSS